MVETERASKEAFQPIALRARSEAPWLFVAPKFGETIDVAALQAFLSQRLSKIEEPDRIEVRDSLPKTQVGKLSKRDLLAQEQALISAGAQ